MIYLLLSIITSSTLLLIFTLFKKHQIHILQAIVVNYWIAFGIGYYRYNAHVRLWDIFKQPWFLGALLLGIGFILIFNLMAITTQKSGIAITSVASKMSVVIPVICGIILYQEQITILKISGITLALLAVYLSTPDKKQNNPKKSSLYLLPVLLFISTGFLDTAIKYIQDTFVPHAETELFSASIFLIAGLLGLVALGMQYAKNKTKVTLKNAIAGVVLGIPNYFSIYFLIKALQIKSVESSVVFPVNNVGIVLLSTVLGLVFFKQKISTKNGIGIFLAIAAIFILTLSI